MSRPKSDPLKTPDGRYLIVRGRLWRASDPHLGSELREGLTKALMDARRDVARALREGDRDLLASSRRKVNEAKIALGERGPTWWGDGTPDYTRYLAKNTPYAEWYAKAQDVKQITACITALLDQRSPTSSICPSDVARALRPGPTEQWRDLMPQIRSCAADMARRKLVRLTRGSEELRPSDLSGGPIRIRRGKNFHA